MTNTHVLRIVSWILIALFVLELPSVGTAATMGDVKVMNVNADLRDGVAVVTYDLIGGLSDTCNVALVMMNAEDPGFQYVPTQGVLGAVGPGQIPGIDKKITWDFRQEFPDGLPDGQLYFVIRAEDLPARSGGSNFWWYAGGAGAIGAGVVLYLLLGKKGPVTIENPDKGFPAEPQRP